MSRNLDTVFGGSATKPAKTPKPIMNPKQSTPPTLSTRYVTLSIPEQTWKSVLECQAKLMGNGQRMKKYQIITSALEQYKKSI